MKKIIKLFILTLILIPTSLLFSACGTIDNTDDDSGLLNITGVILSDASYVYDGEEKEILVNGIIPEGLEVVYSNNTATNAGSYSGYGNGERRRVQ